MPKVKWGEGITAEMIDEAPDSGGSRYEGDLPPAGVYAFDAQSMVKMEASTGSDMVKVLWLVNGKASPGNKKEYDGAPWWDNIVVVKQNMWKIKQLVAALGISSADFLGMVVDKEGKVLKMGNLVVEKGVSLKASVKRSPNRDGDLQLDFGSYIPLKPASDDAKPAKAAKSKKGNTAPEPEPEPEPAKSGKKGKKAKDDKPPF